MAISQKIRFEVFKRDGFVCRYCGKHPPEITLEVDHLIPKSEKGADDINNLLTSCFNCNRGKGKIPLQTLPTTISDNLLVIKEQQKQTRLYYKLLEEAAQLKQKELKDVSHYFFNKWAKSKRDIDKYVFSGQWESTIKIFLKTFNKYEIMEAIDIAHGKFANRPYNQDVNTFKYMCGILHNWRKQRNGQNSIPQA